MPTLAELSDLDELHEFSLDVAECASSMLQAGVVLDQGEGFTSGQQVLQRMEEGGDIHVDYGRLYDEAMAYVFRSGVC